MEMTSRAHRNVSMSNPHDKREILNAAIKKARKSVGDGVPQQNGKQKVEQGGGRIGGKGGY